MGVCFLERKGLPVILFIVEGKGIGREVGFMFL